jgi:hypothetical protein
MTTGVCNVPELLSSLISRAHNLVIEPTFLFSLSCQEHVVLEGMNIISHIPMGSQVNSEKKVQLGNFENLGKFR